MLIDEVDGERAIGRSSANAPGIDGLVYLEGSMAVKPGDWVQVTIEQADEHDVHGQIIA